MKVTLSYSLHRPAVCLVLLLIAPPSQIAWAWDPPDASSSETRPNYLKSLKHGLRWSHFPVHIFFTDSEESQSKRDTLVLLGFDRWVKATENKVDYRVIENQSHAEITVTYDMATRPDNFGELGTTHFSYNPETRRMSKAEIHLNIWRDMSEEELRQLQLTAAHEFGHALGINGHSPDPHDLMYSYTTIDSKLTDRDLNTLRAIYQGFPSNRNRHDLKQARKP